MAAAPAIEQRSTPSWLGTARFLIAAALIWAGFHYLVSGLIRPPLVDHPVALVTARNPVGGLALVAWFVVGAALATVICGGGPRRALMAIGLAAVAWIFEGGQSGGTMQTWLIQRNVVAGPPRGGPYALLAVDYIYLLVALAGAWITSVRLTRGPGAPSMLPDLSPAAITEGLKALGTTVGVAAVATYLLMGPATNAVLRGQVYFAVGVGFYVAAYLARRASTTTYLGWFVAGPWVLGLAGLLVAAVSPALAIPPSHRAIDTIPAWPLARPLPVEMIAMGTLATMMALRPAPRES